MISVLAPLKFSRSTDSSLMFLRVQIRPVGSILQRVRKPWLIVRRAKKVARNRAGSLDWGRIFRLLVKITHRDRFTHRVDDILMNYPPGITAVHSSEDHLRTLFLPGERPKLDCASRVAGAAEFSHSLCCSGFINFLLAESPYHSW